MHLLERGEAVRETLARSPSPGMSTPVRGGGGSSGAPQKSASTAFGTTASTSTPSSRRRAPAVKCEPAIRKSGKR